MKLHECGANSMHPKGFQIDYPFGLENHMFLKITTPAHIFIDQQDIVLHENDVILIEAKIPWSIEGYADFPHINDYISFSFDEDDYIIFNTLRIKFNRAVNVPCPELFMKYHEMICDEFLNNNFQSNIMIHHLLWCFIYKIEMQWNITSLPANKNSHFEKLSRLRLDMYSSPNKDWSVSEAAASLYLSVSYFQHMYKSCFGISFSSDLLNSRIKYSENLLLNTVLPVNEIADRCCINSPSYYSRVFKNKYGMTPLEYRQNHCRTDRK